jgi:hypothetical protein
MKQTVALLDVLLAFEKREGSLQNLAVRPGTKLLEISLPLFQHGILPMHLW